MGHFWSWPCRMKEGVIVNIIYSVFYVFLEGTLHICNQFFNCGGFWWPLFDMLIFYAVIEHQASNVQLYNTQWTNITNHRLSRHYHGASPLYLCSPHSLSTYACTAGPYVTIYMPQAGFDPPRKVIPSSTECEADALPPSHHGWISLAYLLIRLNSPPPLTYPWTKYWP